MTVEVADMSSPDAPLVVTFGRGRDWISPWPFLIRSFPIHCSSVILLFYSVCSLRYNKQ